MAIWTYSIADNQFKLSNYPPLSIDAWADEFEEVPFEIDVEWQFYSTLFYSTNTYHLQMSGKIYKYKENNVGGASSYPALTLFLGGTVGGEGRGGVCVDIANCCELHDFVGSVTENGVTRSLDTPEYSAYGNATYQTDAFVTVNMCTLPILFSDATTDEENYMFRVASGVYGTPEEQQFCLYNPLNNALTQALCETYVVNFGGGEEEIPREYIYISKGVKGTWDEFGQFTQDETAEVLYKGYKVKFSNDATGKLALYPIPYEDGDTDLKWGIKMSDTPVACYYTYDDGVTWQTMTTPTLPFTWIWRNRENEIGTFYSNYGGYGNENTPIFEDEETAYNFITGNGVTIKDAINYDRISNSYPIANDTCEQDDATAFGEVYTRSFFSQQYIVNASVMGEIAGALYDTDSGGITGLWDDIKKGLGMYGDSPIQCIQNACFVPFDATAVFTNVQSQNYIYFGGYQLTLNNGSAHKIIYPNGKYDFGSFDIKPTFKNFRDFEPYTKLYVYLAYIGWYQLDIKKYMGKTVNVTYYFDTRTNTTCAVLTANGVMTDFFNGQMGVNFPVTATDYTAFANAQIQTLMGFNKGGADMSGMAGSFAKGVGTGLVESGLMSAGGVALGLGGVGIAVNGAKTLYGLTQNNINNFTKTIGGSSSMINMYLPQEVCFMFEIQDAMPTDYEQELIGLPSNASGYVGSFSGYLECEQVNLVCSGATANEQSEILHALYSGVYI